MTWRYRYAWRQARKRAQKHADAAAFWRAKAEEHEADIGKLHLLHDEDRRRWAERADRNLIPLPPGLSPTATRDRENAVRLADENARLRAEIEDLRRRNVELADQVAHEGNPS